MKIGYMPENLILQVKDLSKSYGEKVVLDNASVSITEKQKIGMIGRNGVGKTTFFKILLGQEELDMGEVIPMPHLKIGYIQQHDPFLPDEKVIDFFNKIF